MRVFVFDPNAEFNLTNVQRLFPEYSKEATKEKILTTSNRLALALQEVGGILAVRILSRTPQKK